MLKNLFGMPSAQQASFLREENARLKRSIRDLRDEIFRMRNTHCADTAANLLRGSRISSERAEYLRKIIADAEQKEKVTHGKDSNE